jgi:hypothetical protein
MVLMKLLEGRNSVGIYAYFVGVGLKNLVRIFMEFKSIKPVFGKIPSEIVRTNLGVFLKNPLFRSLNVPSLLLGTELRYRFVPYVIKIIKVDQSSSEIE